MEVNYVRFSVALLTTIVTKLQMEPIKPFPEMWMTTPERIISHGYPVEVHNVTTSDGYVLEIHRIPGRPGGIPSDPDLYPIIIAHAFTSSSYNFVTLGPKKALAFIAADAGYDIWMLNARFTEYTTHLNLSNKDPKFWDSSLDHNYLIDVPQSVDYILRTTKAKKFHYIGASLGCLSYTVMCNQREDLAKRVASYSGLGPVYVFDGLKNLLTTIHRAGILDFLLKMNIRVLNNNIRFRQFLATVLCPARGIYEEVCWSVAFLIFGEHYKNIPWEYIPVILNKSQPLPVQFMRHILQMAESRAIIKYDYGEEENLVHYGTVRPPRYNLTGYFAPVSLYFGINDRTFNQKDSNILIDIYKASNVTVKATRFKGKYNHMDPVYGRNTDKLYRMTIEWINSLNVTKKTDV